jgi:hypothetical protein
MEPKYTPAYEFNSRCYENPIYNVLVALLFKRTVMLGGGLLLVFGLSIALYLRLIPGPHRPPEDMVAGSVATAITLAGGFAVLNRVPDGGRPLVRIRIARRSGQSS